MNDLISRQDAIDAVSDCGICIQKIVDLPSAEPRQKTGKWYEDEEVGLCRCDQCQAVNLIHTPFCPMCGARMVGEEE